MSRQWLGALLLTAIVSSACTKSGDALGAGAELDACAGYPAYNRLDEPSPDDHDEVSRYVHGVLRVLDRIDTEERVTVKSGDGEDEEIDVPDEVLADLAALERSMASLRDRLDAAGDDRDAVRAALDDLARDGAFTEADSRLATFHRERCVR